MDTIRIDKRDDGIAILVFDVPGQPHNTLSTDVMTEIEGKTGDLMGDPAIKGIVLVSGKKDSFIAGADLDMLEKITEASDAAELSRRGNELLSRLAKADKPVVAAVHGGALGGGLEVALACSYIIASDHPSTVLALPEVMLGLLPAAGGTQRLPRRIGLPAALPMLLTGKRIRARRALRMGLIDALTTPGGITETAARAALQLATGKLSRRPRKRSVLDRITATGPGRKFALNKAREQVQRKTRGLYPAPLAILECVETGLSRGIDKGLALESEKFGELVVSPESSSLVRLFHWTNELKKDKGAGEARSVDRIAVLGAGFMGAGIASVSLGRWPVVLRDINEEVLSSAAKQVHQGLGKQRRSGSLTNSQRDQRWARLQLTSEVEALRGTDVVIEAVFENLDLKRKVLAEAEQRISPEAVYATNTSALPIADIARDAVHPGRVLGMHYFSPVPKMPLLEIIKSDKTEPWAIETARAVGVGQGKTVIVVGDGPGFYTSRILSLFLNEAIVLLGEGARIEDIDRALTGLGFPVGPIALIDEVGIDVGAHVSQDLGKAFAHRGGEPTDVLARMFEAGLHGRKNRKGFYSYPPPGRKKRKQVNTDVYRFFGDVARRSFPREEIQDRMALMMVNEAMHCLQEGILERPRDGDVGAVMGLGFPPMIGGPFRYVDQRGANNIVARMEQLREQHGDRFEPAQVLAELARGAKRFY